MTDKPNTSITTLDPVQLAINQQLVESGNYEIIYSFLKQRLESTGWMDNVKNYAKETARQKSNGVKDDLTEGPNFNQLMADIEPYAQEKVPENVKVEVLEKIKAYLETIVE